MGLLRRALFLSTFILTGCFSVSRDHDYKGPPPRPEALNAYYSVGNSYQKYNEELTTSNDRYSLKRIHINSLAGETIIDFYQHHERNADLILVFPILGGNNKIADYFAEYFADRGYDSAIVHRSNDFKDPTKFYDIEKVLKENLIRDRIALDLFEKQYGKKNFGSFGISRGAINVAMTAGVDSRLKYNVLALGATDLVRLFKTSNEKRIKKYRNSVMSRFGLTEKEFYDHLENQLKTDPKELAKYMDAKNTLLILGLLDKTVPIQYGVKLRHAIGGPKTVYLFADHYVSIGFSKLIKVASPRMADAVFPFDYIEQEALAFYDKSFKRDEDEGRTLTPFKILQAPLNLLADCIDRLW